MIVWKIINKCSFYVSIIKYFHFLFLTLTFFFVVSCILYNKQKFILFNLMVLLLLIKNLSGQFYYCGRVFAFIICITVNCTVCTWLPLYANNIFALITINNRHRTFIRAGMQSYMSRTFGFINFVMHFDIIIW